MRILINALSATNPSSRHVLLGHLSRFAGMTLGRHEFVVLFHRANRDLQRDLGENVRWVESPGYSSHWAGRTFWERLFLPRMASQLGAQLLFTPSGAVVPGVKIPQISYAMNPWSLVSEVPRRPLERVKAALQRQAYRQAMRKARMMVFLSEFMRQAYRENAGFPEQDSKVIYVGIDEDTLASAGKMKASVAKKPMQILSVSVMAPHKGIETVLEALALVHRKHGVDATLKLVGGWPDPDYEKKIRSMIAQSGLEEKVEIAGHVSREELHRSYAEARVFCLMSWCESFGIPSAEAQAFGTPVITSNCCAMPEVGGEGGVYPEPGDAGAVAGEMARILTDQQAWESLSHKALENVKRFQWEACAQSFVKIFDDLEQEWNYRPSLEMTMSANE